MDQELKDQEVELDEIDQYLNTTQTFKRSLRDRIAKPFDDFGTTANKLTMWRLYLAVPMSACFYATNFLVIDPTTWTVLYTCAVLLYIVAALNDMFDGIVAHYQADKYSIIEMSEKDESKLTFRQKMNLKGTSHFGAVMDPFADKVLDTSVFFLLGWNIIDHRLLFLNLAFASLLTAIRFRFIKRFLEIGGKGAANPFGKKKVIAEVVSIASLGLIPGGPIHFLNGLDLTQWKYWCANIAITFATLFASLSFAGHLKFGFKKFAMERKAKKLARSVNKTR